MKYMKLLETAPPLKAESLADGYRVLAEFNGTVLAGKKTLLGAQFVTWAWDYDRRGVSNGHYYMEDYQTAKEDFTFRSGLMAREQVFDRGVSFFKLLHMKRHTSQSSLQPRSSLPGDSVGLRNHRTCSEAKKTAVPLLNIV